MSIILRFNQNKSLQFLSLYVTQVGRFKAEIPKDGIHIQIDKLMELAKATNWIRQGELTDERQELLDQNMDKVQVLLMKRSIKFRQQNNKISIKFSHDKLEIYVNFSKDFFCFCVLTMKECAHPLEVKTMSRDTTKILINSLWRLDDREWTSSPPVDDVGDLLDFDHDLEHLDDENEHNWQDRSMNMIESWLKCDVLPFTKDVNSFFIQLTSTSTIRIVITDYPFCKCIFNIPGMLTRYANITNMILLEDTMKFIKNFSSIPWIPHPTRASYDIQVLSTDQTIQNY
jgi:hypothetical protein